MTPEVLARIIWEEQCKLTSKERGLALRPWESLSQEDQERAARLAGAVLERILALYPQLRSLL